MSDERKRAERTSRVRAAVGPRTKQVLTTDPTGSDEDDRVVDEEAARVARHARRPAQGRAREGRAARRVRSGRVPRAGTAARPRGRGRCSAGCGTARPRWPAGAIAAVFEADLGKPPRARVRDLGSARRSRPRRSARSTPRRCTTAPRSWSRSSTPAWPRRCAPTSTTAGSCASSRAPRSATASTTACVRALADAVRGELDYRAEAAAQVRFAHGWAGDPVLRVPRVIDELSSDAGPDDDPRPRQDRGRHGRRWLAGRTPPGRARHLSGFAWGSPLVHGLLNADPNPGQLPDRPHRRRSRSRVVPRLRLRRSCSPRPHTRSTASCGRRLLDDDQACAAERFRIALGALGPARAGPIAGDRPPIATGSARCTRRSRPTATSRGPRRTRATSPPRPAACSRGGGSRSLPTCSCCGASASARPR